MVRVQWPSLSCPGAALALQHTAAVGGAARFSLPPPPPADHRATAAGAGRSPAGRLRNLCAASPLLRVLRRHLLCRRRPPQPAICSAVWLRLPCVGGGGDLPHRSGGAAQRAGQRAGGAAGGVRRRWRSGHTGLLGAARCDRSHARRALGRRLVLQLRRGRRSRRVRQRLWPKPLAGWPCFHTCHFDFTCLVFLL